MQVTVEEQGKFKRKLTIEVPLPEVQSTYDEVYTQIRTNLRVPGFRPGKYPRQLAEKRFKALMAQEALQTLVPRYLDEALKEKELRPATEPQFNNIDIDQRRPLKFDVEFEVAPSFGLVPPSEFKLEDPPIVVDDAAIDGRIQEMRHSRATLGDKGAEPALTGDVVTFDVEGKLDGEPVPGGAGTGQRTEVGSGQFLPEFDAAFVGMRAGESKTFPVTFPADYQQATLAGKTAEFSAKVTKVEQKVLPEVNADFFKQFATVETEEAFRQHVSDLLRKERERANLESQHAALLRQMNEKYTFDVPEALLEEQLHQFEHELEHEAPEVLKDEALLAQRKEEQRGKIERDLRANFVVDAYAREHKLQVDPDEVRQRFYLQAYMMRQDPNKILRTPLGERLLARIQRRLITDAVLTHLVYAALGKPQPEPVRQEPPAAAGPEQSQQAVG
ncbi:MAG TPA: trigger factor [bacterium]|nr:trigger factor [bacterium]